MWIFCILKNGFLDYFEKLQNWQIWVHIFTWHQLAGSVQQLLFRQTICSPVPCQCLLRLGSKRKVKYFFYLCQSKVEKQAQVCAHTYIWIHTLTHFADCLPAVSGIWFYKTTGKHSCYTWRSCYRCYEACSWTRPRPLGVLSPQMPLKQEVSTGSGVRHGLYSSLNHLPSWVTLDKSIHFSGPQVPSTVKGRKKEQLQHWGSCQVQWKEFIPACHQVPDSRL